MHVQLLDPEYLDHEKDGPISGGGRIIQCVEYDRIGRRRGYWLFPEHPGGSYHRGQSEFVAARDIVHMYRVVADSVLHEGVALTAYQAQDGPNVIWGFDSISGRLSALVAEVQNYNAEADFLESRQLILESPGR